MPPRPERPGGAPRGGGKPPSSVTAGRRLLRWAGLLAPGLREIERHRPLVAPLVLVAVLSGAAAFSIQPVVADAASGEVARGLMALFWVTALLSPVAAALKALVLAVLAWSVLVLLGREVPLRLLGSIFLYGEAVLALHGVAVVAVLHLRGPGAVSGPGDLYVPMGLEGLVPADAPVLAAVARGATLFHGLWIAFLVLALVRVGRLPAGPAWAVAGGAWILALGIASVRALALP